MKKLLNRRMFLRGAGGAVMAIPFLPSLTSRTFAADPDPGPPGKCFFAVGTDHGEVWGKNIYPNDAMLTQQLNYAGRDVRYGQLPSLADASGKVSWSPMYSASAQIMTPTLASKFNILRGVDIPYRIGHHLGGHLGNFAATTGNVTGGLSNAGYAAPTIDQVMAYSPNFYTEADLNTKMTHRSFCVLGGGLSFNFTSPEAKTGSVVSMQAHKDNEELFAYLFNPSIAYHGIDATIVDRVKQSYDLLKKDPRLSKGDLLRLNQHVDQMFEVERKLKVSGLIEVPQFPAHVCGKVGPGSLGQDCKGKTSSHWNHHSGDTMKSNANFNADYCDLMTDMIALAFSTGASRIATWRQSLKFTDGATNDWHGQVAHCGLGASIAQQWALGWNQGTFEHILVKLAAKLDAVDAGNGTTLLDNSLLMQTSEAGQLTHHTGCVHYPLVMAGGAGGYFKTGMFVDFSNTNKTFDDFNDVLAEKPGLIPESPGLYYNQFLANALMSMGVPKEEWEHFTEFTPQGPKNSDPTKGYGFHYVDPKRAQDYAQAKLVMSEKLPVIT